MTYETDGALRAADRVWSGSAPAKRTAIHHRCMASIQAEPIHWLWPGRIARGKIAMIAGHPGLGKSQLMAYLAATVTTGGQWPVSGECCAVGDVAFLCAEDDAADTIQPRLTAAGADLNRIIILDSVGAVDVDGKSTKRSLSLQRDIGELDALLEEKPEIALMVIDPITAYMGNVDSHKTADVRGVLTPLAEMAARHRVAVVCVSHLNKGGDTDAMMRVTGSLAYVAAARAAYLVAADSENPARRLFLPMKNNLSQQQPGLAFTIQPERLESGIDSSRVAWESTAVHQTANDVLALSQGSNGKNSAVEEAKDFLANALSEGSVLAKDIKQKAVDAGISHRTLERAKVSLGVEARKLDVKKGWVWELPKAANNAEECQP